MSQIKTNSKLIESLLNDEIVIEGQKISISPDQEAILVRNVPLTNNYAREDQEPILFHFAEENFEEIEENLFVLKKLEGKLLSASPEKVGDFSVNSRVWTASSGAIGHRFGKKYPQDKRWWHIPRPGNHACYGPYVTLPKGDYDFWWYIKGPRLRCPGPTNADIFSMDICTKTGREIIVPKTYFPWSLICREAAGEIKGAFGILNVHLSKSTTRIECRLSAESHCPPVVAQALEIIKQ